MDTYRWPEPRLPRASTIFALLYLLAAAVVVGFGFAHQYAPRLDRLDSDELEYWRIAGRLLDGTMEVQSKRTLAFPLFLAAIRMVRDDFRTVQVVVSLAYAFAPPMLFLVTRRMTGSTLAGSVAGAALALWPPAIFYGASLYSETLALPLFLLSLLLVPLGSRLAGGSFAIGVGAALLAGLALGVTTQVRTMYQLFLPVLLLILLVEERRWTVALARFGLILAGWLAVILPWSIHVSSAAGHPILVTSNGGETLAGGLTPELFRRDGVSTATGGKSVWEGPGKWLQPNLNGYLSKADMTLPPDQQDGLMKDRATAWILAHPGDAVYIEVRKFAYMWGIYPIARNGRTQVLFGNLPILALLAVAAAGLVALRGRRIQLARFWLLPFFVSGVALISWGSWRFRMPGDAGLLAIAATAAVWWWSRRRAGPTSSSR